MEVKAHIYIDEAAVFEQNGKWGWFYDVSMTSPWEHTDDDVCDAHFNTEEEALSNLRETLYNLGFEYDYIDEVIEQIKTRNEEVIK